jgi:hypothetical protein
MLHERAGSAAPPRQQAASLQRSRTILVAAPGAELRRSIVFALEAEGYAVDPHLSLRAATNSPRASSAHCLIVDENALDDQALALHEFGRPIILLVDRLRDIPDLSAMKVLAKPLLGRQLTDTVQSALAGARAVPK